nr:PASTA domain-containing protein [Curtobacterium flaccumfaciens]
MQLPDVTQQQFSAAKATVEQLGLTVNPAPSYSCTGGLVTQQDTPAGDVAQGSAVTLTYCARSAAPSKAPTSNNDSGGNNGNDDRGDDQGDDGR